MPLRDTSAIDEWERDHRPYSYQVLAVRTWVDGLNRYSAAFPSQPFPELSTPERHVRTCKVPGSDGVELVYSVTFPDEDITIITVVSTRGMA